MSKSKYVLQQDILIPRDNGDLRVEIRVSEPILIKDRDGDPTWACYLQLNGLHDIRNPSLGFTSFGAMMNACVSAYQLLMEVVGPKGKVVMVSDRTPGPPTEDCLWSLKELFQFDRIK